MSETIVLFPLMEKKKHTQTYGEGNTSTIIRGPSNVNEREDYQFLYTMTGNTMKTPISQTMIKSDIKLALQFTHKR